MVDGFEFIVSCVFCFTLGTVFGGTFDYKKTYSKYDKLRNFYNFLKVNGYIVAKSEKEIVLAFLKKEESQHETICNEVKYKMFKDDVL